MATSREELLLVIKAMKEGTGAKDMQKELGDTEKAAEQVGKKSELMSKGLAIAQGAAIAMGVAFLKNIPALLETAEQFERTETALIAYSGGAAEAAEMTKRVQDAAGGAISKLGAMQNATRLLSMGLASNADEAAKMTDIAVTLGATMGKGPQEAFEEFTLLLANQSILRLDTFGISGAAVKERMAELGDEMGITDRQTAFLTATMEIAADKMGALDEAGFKATSSLDRLKAVTEDAKVAAATWLADGLMPIIDGLFSVGDALVGHQDQLVESSTSYEDFREEMERAKSEAGLLGLGFDILTEQEYNTQQQTIEAKVALSQLGMQAEVTQEKLLDLSDVGIFGVEQSLKDMQAFIDGPVGAAMTDFKTDIDELTLKEAGLILKIQQLNEQKQLTPEQAAELSELQSELGNVQMKIDEVKAAHEAKTKQILFDLAAERIAMMDLPFEEQFALLNTLAGEWGLIDEATMNTFNEIDQILFDFANGASVADTVSAIDDIRGKMDGVVGTHNIHFNITTSGKMPAVPDKGTPGAALQHGADFVVPPGFPNDTFGPIFVTTGERVLVQTPQQQAQTREGMTLIVNNYGPADSLFHEIHMLEQLAEMGV